VPELALVLVQELVLVLAQVKAPELERALVQVPELDLVLALEKAPACLTHRTELLTSCPSAPQAR
jgi:hypothetical protein